MEEQVTLTQMLRAREERAARQQALLEQYGLPLVSFVMNIAGPVKDSPLIRQGFALGEKLLFQQLLRENVPCVYQEKVNAPTGPEGLYVVKAPAAQVKSLAEELEEGFPLGRLWDMDVLSPQGIKLERAAPRRCLLCGQPAQVCARSRSHPLEELQNRTRQLLEESIYRWEQETAASLACRALLYEVSVTPKPGLVDRQNSGSHQDMDFYTFLDSAVVLHPYFCQCVQMGQRTRNQSPQETFSRLRLSGRLAESGMLAATGGANTHKGAVFTLGLVCGGLGRLGMERWSSPERVLAEVKAMAQGIVDQELSSLAENTARTPGERFYLQYGITGVRGQAEQGFPAVLEVGLPVLETGMEQGRSRDEAGAGALLSLLAQIQDTSMIRRGGLAAQREQSARLRTLLAKDPFPSREILEALDLEYIQANWSPGGSADLLALCWLLHFLREV